MLNKHLLNYIECPKNPLYNFLLGKCYEDIGQTASATSFYIRTAEFGGNDDLLIYESLLRMSLCFQRQGSRVFTIKGILLRAISLLPDRPEAYFLLSRIYEINKDWQESYTFAVLGEKLIDSNIKLRTDVEYLGKYGFTFEKAVSGWWIGLYDESINLLHQLQKNPNILDIYKQSVNNNLINLGNNWKEPITYNDSQHNQLKLKFKGSDTIKENYSQCHQDLFVLTMLNGKTNGLFLEIGCGDPFYGNNTALLEKNFSWDGISIDINIDTTNNFANYRYSKVICADATELNYEEILEDCDYDYLQIDCDPSMTSYKTLLKIPFNTHKFAVITFEHDYYSDEDSGIRELSRKYLESYGYKLVVNNIAPDKYNSFEDWWVHPDLVDNERITKMMCISNEPKKSDNYILNIS